MSFEDILGLVDEQNLEFSVRQVHLLLRKLEEVGDRIAVDDRAETEVLVEQTRRAFDTHPDRIAQIRELRHPV